MKVGTRKEWLAVGVALLAQEKELTRRSDELARKRQALRATWQMLDRTPKGRGGDPEGWPRRHDDYERARGAS